MQELQASEQGWEPMASSSAFFCDSVENAHRTNQLSNLLFPRINGGMGLPVSGTAVDPVRLLFQAK
jgi:hypothetical protein